MSRCPKGHEGLVFGKGDYYTGVVAPDGYRERVTEESAYCEVCDKHYDPSDIEDEEEVTTIPCSLCGKSTTWDTTYGDLCGKCCRADNE